MFRFALGILVIGAALGCGTASASAAASGTSLNKHSASDGMATPVYCRRCLRPHRYVTRRGYVAPRRYIAPRRHASNCQGDGVVTITYRGGDFLCVPSNRVNTHMF